MKDITIILPCYNEAKSLPDLFQQIKSFKEDINFLIVDNGSTDNTQKILQELEITNNISIKLKTKNTGYGAGIKFGLLFVNTKYVGWMHSDLQQEIEVLNNVKNLLKKHFSSDTKNLIALKGHRTKRSLFDSFFTFSVSCFASILFIRKCWDIAGQPNIFLMKDLKFIECAPNNHSFEFFVYLKFILAGGNFVRFNAPFLKRKYGVSSWDKGFKSKLNHSWMIFKYILRLRFTNII